MLMRWSTFQKNNLLTCLEVFKMFASFHSQELLHSELGSILRNSEMLTKVLHKDFLLSVIYIIENKIIHINNNTGNMVHLHK